MEFTTTWFPAREGAVYPQSNVLDAGELMKFPDQGLYAISPAGNRKPDQIISDIAAAIQGGAAVVQYRDKSSSKDYQLTKALVEVCHHGQVPLIINDDIDLAIRCGADGVHLGKNDANLTGARTRLGNNAIIGISCYDSLDKAVIAENNGASYVAFGRFFPSGTKPMAPPAHIETLKQAKKKLQIPIVAIGGILPENGEPLLNAGADLLAVVGGIFDHDPEPSARRYQGLFI